MVDHAPLPYVTPAFIASLRGKDDGIVKAAKLRASLIDALDSLNELMKDAPTEQRRVLYEKAADEVAGAVLALDAVARAVRAGR